MPADDDDVAISVYDDRQLHWFLGPIGTMLGQDAHDLDFLALSATLAYFEGVQQFREGRTSVGRSGKAFGVAAARVLGVKATSAVVARLYNEARNPMFHHSFIYSRTYIVRGLAEAVAIGPDDYLWIEPKLLYECVCRDHAAFVRALRTGGDPPMKRNFLKLWQELWERS